MHLESKQYYNVVLGSGYTIKIVEEFRNAIYLMSLGGKVLIQI